MADRRAVAFHEAGHFVVSYQLSPSTYRGKITITPREDLLGMVQVEDSWNDKMARNDVLVCFAGLAAEKQYDPQADPRGARSDTETALKLLNQLGEPEGETEWRARADQLVADHWKEIEALACEVIDKKTLDADEAEIVIDIARGEEGATWEALERYRTLKAHSRNG